MAELKIFSDKYVHYGLKPASDFTVIRTSREGVLRSVADEVSEMVKLTDNEMAYLLGMTPRNLHRIPADKRLGTDASERLLLLKNVLIHALDTFEGKENVVRNWLRTSLSELNDQTPLQLMDTITGFGMVDDVLGRLDYGLPA
ncbi:antitoxin Xre/MbcA/ParS toxin-binding domain-containing protein [Arcticibacter sp.]|uniref:antitoxin Xre/MbcA/ParS toxin-binding domain-containing protein n=1 Tax=Arcticibacter sp. TaxID=1872630 RepID=UPI003890C389